MIYREIIDFWYSESVSSQWFASTPELDAEIESRFESVWQLAVSGQLDNWRDEPEGLLALAIILDQFPLNMFRGQARAFSSEGQAIEVAKYAIDRELDTQLPKDRRTFLYMPLMHSESLADQALAIEKFNTAGLQGNAQFARHHYSIVERFGRFPHRNEILGRESTEAELTYLASKEAFTG